MIIDINDRKSWITDIKYMECFINYFSFSISILILLFLISDFD